ncbi:MAG: diacylglycerol kinase family protein [Candidatus Melainabacteria bacterium]|nr:diacylglycerol kinase family protein [Candidatus Melainabacteria bacterium]
MAKHVLVIFNPTAKSQVHPDEWIGKLVEELNKEDEYLVSFYPTTAETQPQHLVPLFAPPLDLAIAAGGDGTVRFALAALAKAEQSIPVAIFPLGTGNVLARNLGIVDVNLFADPLQKAYEYVKHGEPRRMDMGMLNGQYFAGMAGVGPLSDAFMTPPRNEKTKFKLWAYVKALLKSITKPPRIFKITTGGKTFKVEASGLFIGNVQDLGLGRDVDFDKLSDGYLDLHVVNPTNFKEYVGLGFRYAGGSKTEDNPEYIMQIKEALIELVPRQGVRSAFQKAAHKLHSMFSGEAPADDPSRSDQLPCMIDGEPAGHTPMRLTVLPQAVNVWVPSQKIETEPTDQSHLEVA